MNEQVTPSCTVHCTRLVGHWSHHITSLHTTHHTTPHYVITSHHSTLHITLHHTTSSQPILPHSTWQLTLLSSTTARSGWVSSKRLSTKEVCKGRNTTMANVSCHIYHKLHKLVVTSKPLLGATSSPPLTHVNKHPIYTCIQTHEYH